MKIKRSTLIPAALLIYLAIMASIGWKQYQIGAMSATYYFGVLALTIATIVALHFNLKRRERLREERKNESEKQNKK